MSNFPSTIEYKFKVTNNLDKDNAQQKKFNFYLGLPYSKRKYRYMQVVNFATNKEGQHLFNVILGHRESSVAAMSDDILRNGSSTCKPAVTKVMRITYASVNVGQTSILYNDANKKTLDTADWTGISGEYMKIKSFRTNGNDEVLGLIFDAADRNIVSARKNDNTNVVAKPEAPVDEMAKKDRIISELKAHIADDDNSIQKQYELIQGYMVTVKDLEEKLEARDKDISEMGRQIDYSQDYIAELKRENEFTENQAENLEEKVKEKEAAIDTLTEEIEDRDRRIKSLTEQIGYLKSDLAARDSEIEELLTDVNNLRDQIGATESKPDETQKTFRGKFIDQIVDEFREKLEILSDDELLELFKRSNV